jgi:hypothetical protein
MAHWPEVYRVSALPPEHPWLRHFSLTVEYWKEGLWRITDGFTELDANANARHHSDYETREEFIAVLRFTRERALELAEEFAPLMTANGMTVGEVLAKDPVELR